MTDFEKPNWDGGHPPPDARVGLHATPSNSVECKHRKGWLVDCYECGRQGHGDGLLSNNDVRVRLEMLEYAVFIKVERDSTRLFHDDVPVERAMRPVLRGSRWRRKASGIEHVVVCDEIDPVDWNARYEWVSDPQPEPTIECEEDAASCDCSYHENVRRAEESHRDPQPERAPKPAIWCPKHQCALPCKWCANSGISNFRDTTPEEKRQAEVDSGIIRAAEGVTLEPGEYEVVEIASYDESPALSIGDRFTLSEPLTCPKHGGLGLDGTEIDWVVENAKQELTEVTAVRRVEAQPERAREANSHTHEYLLGYGEYRELVNEVERLTRVVERLTAVDAENRDNVTLALNGGAMDWSPDWPELIGVAGKIFDRWQERAAEARALTSERDAAVAKLGEHEKEDAALRQLFGLSGLDIDDCATIDLAARLELQRVEARAQVAKLTRELATEQEQISEYSQALNQFCCSLGIDPHCTTGPTDRRRQVAQKVAELVKRDWFRYDLEAMLWATRDEHTADEMLEEVARLQGDLSKAGVQRRQQLDEELQQIDDAIVAAGGEREAAPTAFIASQSAQISWLRDELTRAQHQAHTAINRDRTGLAGGLLHVKAIAQGYEWITEGHWGSYDHEQQTIETLRREVGDLIRGVVDGCMRYLRASGQRADEAAKFKLEAKPARGERIATEAKIRGLVDQTWSLGAEIEEGHYLAAKLTAELAACMLVVDAARAWRAKAVPSSPRYDNAWWKLYDAVDALPVAVAGVEALEGKQS